MTETSEKSNLQSDLLSEIETWNSIAHARLSATRDARKRAEADAQLLANRIALLKEEDAKSWRRIEECQRRTAEITARRLKNEQDALNKLARSQSRHAQEEEKRRTISATRVRAQSARNRAAADLAAARNRAASEQRAERQLLLEEGRKQTTPRSIMSVSTSSAAGSCAEEKLPLTARSRSQSATKRKELTQLTIEERELVGRLKCASARIRSRRPPLPPVAIEDVPFPSLHDFQ
eukprot:TRINITY_DN44826_c0_g1_i1.p1 TRINITY_DN44826_c0_g1~~TRINITY_DN44826_c0_g1_i1.p1  ORF type:complete len:235 (-),score=33.27 TRINITY_DN44826_c0_g1_i1:144-848(-)